ncbi:hypothetical protein EDC96DRAFT_550365 [Choanephora cucurbitarum]|nr:hypothetical protein EDC96DRAFT_550365 [Choanephora cucurbitarum]
MLKGLPVESAKQVKCLLKRTSNYSIITRQLMNALFFYQSLYFATTPGTMNHHMIFMLNIFHMTSGRQLHFEGVRLLVKKTNDMFRQPDRQRIYLIRFDYSILGILNDLLRYLIGCIPSFLNRLTLEMLYDSLFFLHVDRNGYLFNTLLKMINYIQFVKEVIEYSGSNCVDHLTYLHMSTESVKSYICQVNRALSLVSLFPNDGYPKKLNSLLSAPLIEYLCRKSLTDA